MGEQLGDGRRVADVGDGGLDRWIRLLELSQQAETSICPAARGMTPRRSSPCTQPSREAIAALLSWTILSTRRAPARNSWPAGVSRTLRLRAVEEPGSDLPLQLGDLVAEAGLPDVTTGRCPSEVEFVGDRQRELHLP
jgi:hypothetical protein